eukprot:SAG31_NODE_27114_length_431_cov_0.834337_1_plen_56_part_10
MLEYAPANNIASDEILRGFICLQDRPKLVRNNLSTERIEERHNMDVTMEPCDNNSA